MDCAVRATYEASTIYSLDSARQLKCSLPYKSRCFANSDYFTRRRLAGVNEVWNTENDIFIIDTYYNEDTYGYYGPVAYFLNPFSKDTTRYCEEEGGFSLIDPVTIPEHADDYDCYSLTPGP